MGFFTGIEKATFQARDPWVLPGSFLLTVDYIKINPSWQNNTYFFVARFYINESTNPERPVGTYMSWVFNMDKPTREFALGKVKNFMAAVDGCDETAITEAVMDKAIGAENPGKGEKVRLSARNAPQQKKPTENYTHCNWQTVDQSTGLSVGALPMKSLLPI